MILTDQEIIKKLKIKPTDRVLDIGGSMRQHELINVDTLVDFTRPENVPYWPTKLLADHFVKADITKERLPFKDKEFDVVLCTHTLEDLPNPFLIMDEMSRVAKRGLIVTPSMGEDMVFMPIDFTDWLTGARRVPGQAHHRWFFINRQNSLSVIPKNYPILYTNDFQIVGWTGEPEMVYIWSKSIKYTEFNSINIHELIEEYETYTKVHNTEINKGKVLFFVDGPLNLLRALLKIILHKGEGYTNRKHLK